MQTTLVMTVLGPDRTGLVESVASVVGEHGGNWLESRMCPLGGEALSQARAKILVPANVARDKLRQTLEGGLAGLTVELERIK